MINRTAQARSDLKLDLLLSMRLAPLVLVLNLLTGCLYLNSEPRSNEVKGRVLDAKTHLPIKNAVIQLDIAPHHTTYSDATGHFRLKKTRNQHILALPPEGWWPQNKTDSAEIQHPDDEPYELSPGYGDGSIDIGDILLYPRAVFFVGMSRQAAATEIGMYAGEIPRRNDYPVLEGDKITTRSFYRSLNFDTVLMLDFRDERVVQMVYWTKNNFDGDRSHRAKTELRIESLKFDSATHEVSLEMVK
jgi:hypothetical protein